MQLSLWVRESFPRGPAASGVIPFRRNWVARISHNFFIPIAVYPVVQFLRARENRDVRLLLSFVGKGKKKRVNGDTLRQSLSRSSRRCLKFDIPTQSIRRNRCSLILFFSPKPTTGGVVACRKTRLRAVKLGKIFKKRTWVFDAPFTCTSCFYYSLVLCIPFALPQIITRNI